MAAIEIMGSEFMSNECNKNKGFTLIELMIVVAIVAIIAAIGIPSYSAQVQKTKRVDAKNALLQTAQSLEKCMSLYGVYNNTACSVGNGDTIDSSEEYYTVTVTSAAATFSLSAAPKPGGAQAGDSHCASMTYTNTSAKSGTNNDCW